MPDSLYLTLLLLCAIGAGLIGGVFFAFSAFVMKALARLPAREAVAAMNAINVAVVNALFLGVFLGTAVLCAAAAVADSAIKASAEAENFITFMAGSCGLRLCQPWPAV